MSKSVEEQIRRRLVRAMSIAQLYDVDAQGEAVIERQADEATQAILNIIDTEVERAEGEAQATLNKELLERLKKLKEVRPASGPNRNGTSECKRKAHNRAINKVIQELGLE